MPNVPSYGGVLNSAGVERNVGDTITASGRVLVDASQLPAALTTAGNLKVALAESSASQSVAVSNTVSTTSNQLPSALTASGNLKVAIQEGTSGTVHNVTGDGIDGSLVDSAGLQAYNGTNWERVRSVNTGQVVTTLKSSTGVELGIVSLPSVTDGTSLTLNGLAVASSNFGWNGYNYDRYRVATVFKWAEFLTFTTNTVLQVWSPTSGRKVRVMGFTISVSAACAINVRLGAAGSGTRFYTLRFPTGGGTHTVSLGNGLIASAVNHVLEIQNPTSPSSGTTDVHVAAWGTEE